MKCFLSRPVTAFLIGYESHNLSFFIGPGPLRCLKVVFPIILIRLLLEQLFERASVVVIVDRETVLEGRLVLNSSSCFMALAVLSGSSLELPHKEGRFSVWWIWAENACLISSEAPCCSH